MKESLHYHYEIKGEKNPGIPLILIHGFAQSSATWEHLVPLFAETRPVIVVDLVGHGKSDGPAHPGPYQMSAMIEAFEAFFEAAGYSQIILLGYSMGGRVAASFAAAHPERIAALVLESAGLGPRNEEERTQFIERERALIERLERDSIEEFVAYWEQLPLFETQQTLPADIQERLRAERLNNNPQALAQVVRGSGHATMSNLRPLLTDLSRPKMYIAGISDVYYGEVAQSIRNQGLAQVALLDAGHNTHLENAAAFYEVVNQFCEEVEAGQMSEQTENPREKKEDTSFFFRDSSTTSEESGEDHMAEQAENSNEEKKSNPHVYGNAGSPSKKVEKTEEENTSVLDQIVRAFYEEVGSNKEGEEAEEVESREYVTAVGKTEKIKRVETPEEPEKAEEKEENNLVSTGQERESMSAIAWSKGRTYQEIIYETYEGIAKITINRPERRNAFTPLTVNELYDAFSEARDDADIGVILLTGANHGGAHEDEAFCSGGDQTIRGHGGYVGSDNIPRLNVLDLQRLIRVVPKPIIAMVNGYAIGGGHVLHILCDLSIAAETAQFGQTGPKVGSFDAGYGAGYLADIVGQKKAREIWYLCRQYSAAEALEMGLVNKVVPFDQLEAECVAWAQEMLAFSPTALRFMKASFNAATDGLAGIQQLAGDATLLYYTTDEAKEGRDAFKEKRAPDFTKFNRFR